MPDKTVSQQVQELEEMIDKLGKLHDDFAHATVRYVLDRNWDKAAETAAEADRTLVALRKCFVLLLSAPDD